MKINIHLNIKIDKKYIEFIGRKDMINVLASITIAEDINGQLGVGLDLQVNEETLKKLQDLMPKLTNDICSLKIEDVQSTIETGMRERIAKEVKSKLEVIDIDKYLQEDMDLLKEEIIAMSLLNEGGNQ